MTIVSVLAICATYIMKLIRWEWLHLHLSLNTQFPPFFSVLYCPLGLGDLIGLALTLYFFMVAHKLHANPCWKPSWSLWRHGRGFAGAGDISCKGSALWCFFLLWSLPVLQLWFFFLCLQLQSLQYDLQRDFARVTDEADHSIVLALLQVAFLGKYDG